MKRSDLSDTRSYVHAPHSQQGLPAPILANEKLPNGRCRVRVVKEKDSNFEVELVPLGRALDRALRSITI